MTILDIIVACQKQEPVSEEDLRLTVVALSAMLGTVERDLRELVWSVLADRPSAKMRAEFSKKADDVRFKSRKMTPRDYLGPTHTPGTTENAALRKIDTAILKKATGEDL